MIKQTLKILSAIALLSVFFSTESNAQFELGGGLVFGTDVEELGITVDGNYYFDENWSISPNFTIFFAEDPINFFTINVDGRYNFEVGPSPTIVYPLGGLNLAIVSVEDTGFGDDDSDTELGINLGGGVNHFFNSNFGILGELKFVIGDADQIVLTGGVVYRFN